VSQTDELSEWQAALSQWAKSIHRKRLERAFLSGEELLVGNAERLLHSFSRLGVWAKELSHACDCGEVDGPELAEQLRKLGEFSDFAFKAWEVQAR
jgi:hypothetical protein